MNPVGEKIGKLFAVESVIGPCAGWRGKLISNTLGLKQNNYIDYI